ncbi:siphovirus ReqiPepy6 Gp37-like family protein [Wukongibacter sp. M2B1]|uniref:siphovirus ReqiPepy6 Gp37-like family protein n=1 Tax=Wukongibacter sp. M2B1 TaxID=3088895 RepID=UPI003D7A9F29
MELYIFNRDLEPQGIIEGYDSLRWVRRYSQCGEFELQTALTASNLKLLQQENIIYKKDDTEAGVINYINYKLDTDGKEIIVVKGKFATGYLNRRITLGANTITDTAENIMRILLNDNAINPTDSNRTISNLILGVNNGFTENASYTLDNKELLEDIENIAALAELGIRTDFDITDKKLVFNLYKGLNRSLNQTTNPRAVFSKEFQNILEQEYIGSNNNYKNVAYGNSTSLGNATGLDRFEIYTNNDLDVELSKRPKITTFDSKINLNSNLKYKVAFDLGDIVTFESKKWGIVIDTRITEIEEVYEQDGLSINVVFGNSIPTLIDKIKKEIK